MASCGTSGECWEWAKVYLDDCICSPRDQVSFVLGLISVLSWGVAEIPQIITNYKEKSVEGLSLGFLITWIIGCILLYLTLSFLYLLYFPILPNAIYHHLCFSNLMYFVFPGIFSIFSVVFLSLLPWVLFLKSTDSCVLILDTLIIYVLFVSYMFASGLFFMLFLLSSLFFPLYPVWCCCVYLSEKSILYQHGRNVLFR